MVAMVEQRFDPTIQAEPTLKQLVQRASDILDDCSRQTAWPAVADWKLNSIPANQSVELNIHDPELGIDAKQTFSMAQLNGQGLEMAVYWAWDKLLSRRSSARIERIMRSIREEGEDLK
jgi:hypothetical protein